MSIDRTVIPEAEAIQSQTNFYVLGFTKINYFFEFEDPWGYNEIQKSK